MKDENKTKEELIKELKTLREERGKGALKNTTERKQVEEKIKHLNLVLRAIRNVNQLIVREKDPEKLLKGTCENLIKTRGYYNAWIVLLDKKGKLETYAETGLGKAFLPMIELLKKGRLTACGKKALKQLEVVITEDPASACTGCPLAQGYSGRGAMTIRLEHSGKVYGLMSISIPAHLAVDQEEQSLFEEVVGDIAFALYNIEMDKERKQAQERLKKTLDATIETMSKIIEVKDPYTAGHQERVSQLAVAIAKELNLSKNKVEGIRIASLIHDVGKISVPIEILSKSTTLTDIEFALIKAHSQTGYDILKSIDFSYPVAQIILQHHEKINGTGYPNQLKGDEILLEAKIIGVADVVEAMSSHRPYRPALGIDVALKEISQNKGILYDPEIVDVCLKLYKEKGFKFK
ncbi:MAG: HD domain-containing protein [Candidatus Atribacteria bacterium]|nr:HD domain-containing protein [Candidatus Atribacteria bacterium]